MILSRRLLAVLIGTALVAVSCSDDDDTEATDTETSVETTEASTTEASDTTATTAAAAETTSSATDASAADDSTAEDGAVAVELGVWYVDMPPTLEAGSISFDISNADTERPHALAVVKGDAYEDLPLLDNGAVDTEAMADDFLGATENIESGAAGAITIDLEAGNYVFFCPINFGPNSHAGAGQVLSVTVG